MRAAKATTIVSIIEYFNLAFTPAKDNITELQDPEVARKAGKVARVPILAGTTAQEGRVEGEFSSEHFLLLLLLTSSLQLEHGQTNTTAALLSFVGNHTILIDEVEQEYAIGALSSREIIENCSFFPGNSPSCD